jgi:hypothetical protein
VAIRSGQPHGLTVGGIGCDAASVRASTVRKIALALPEAEERETWGTATFRVRNRIFTMFSEGERDAWVKSTADEQHALIAMYPKTFFFPPYVGPNGWIGVHIATVARGEMSELVEEAWRLTAPKRLVAAFDGEGSPTSRARSEARG